MNENESNQNYPELERRLRAFGSAPLRPELADHTFEQVCSPGRRRMNGARLKLVAAAAIAGFAAAGVGLAAADVLPAPVQDAAHDTLATVGVHVPPGHNRYNDPTVCPGGPYRNHGAYVRSHKNDPNAGASPCGKPVQSVDPSGKPKSTDKGADTETGDVGDTGHGPPPWAHGKGKPDEPGAASSAPGKQTKPDKSSSTTTTPTTTKSTSPTPTTTSTSTTSTTSTTMKP